MLNKKSSNSESAFLSSRFSWGIHFRMFIERFFLLNKNSKKSQEWVFWGDTGGYSLSRWQKGSAGEVARKSVASLPEYIFFSKGAFPGQHCRVVHFVCIAVPIGEHVFANWFYSNMNVFERCFAFCTLRREIKCIFVLKESTEPFRQIRSAWTTPTKVWALLFIYQMKVHATVKLFCFNSCFCWHSGSSSRIERTVLRIVFYFRFESIVHVQVFGEFFGRISSQVFWENILAWHSRIVQKKKVLPTSVRPVMWGFDHALRLFPPPDLLLLGDSCKTFKSTQVRIRVCFRNADLPQN